MSLTDTGENAVLDNLVQIAPYLVLFSADPGEAGSLVAEVNDAQTPRYDSSADWGAAAAGQKANNAIISVVAGADLGNVSHWGLADSAVAGAGTLQFYEQLRDQGGTPVTRNVLNGDSLDFAIGQLTLTAD